MKTLLTIAVAMLLAGCSFFTPTVRVMVDPSCTWFEDQTFSDQTKDWLSGDLPFEEWADTWPPFVVRDFSEVANNNDLYKQEC